MNFAAPSRSFLAGIALAAPFLANPLPSNIWGLVAVIPLAVHLLLNGVRVHDIRLNPMIGVTLLVVLCHCFFLFIGSTPYYFDVFRDMALAVSACAIIMVVKQENRSGVVDGFFAAAITVAVFSSFVGLAKFVLLANGVFIPAFVNACGVAYPQGSSLCGDYNLFGLLLLTGGLGLIRSISLSRYTQWWKVVSLAVVVLALMLAGSRRGVILAPLLFVYLGILVVKLRLDIRRVAVPVVVTLGAVVAGILMPPYTLDSPDTVVIQPGETVEARGVDVVEDVPAAQPPASQIGETDRIAEPSGDSSDTDGDIAVRDSSVSALTSTMSAENSYGFSSRVDRWLLGWEMIKDRPLLGRGFSYHEEFSCRFVECQHIDYPHAPIMSGWIAGGVVGLASAIVFYGFALASLVLFRSTGWDDGSLPLLIAVLPYSFISGDTVLSLPQLVIAALLSWRLSGLGGASPATKIAT